MPPSLSDPEPLAAQVFCSDGNRWFAEVSGDFNPLHLDPVKARRLVFGSCVAHGIHLVLWSLECWANAVIPNTLWSLLSIEAQFDRPVRTGSEATCTVRSSEEGRTTLLVMADGQICLRLRFAWSACTAKDVARDYLPGNPPRETCRVVDLSDASNESGKISLNMDLIGLRCRLPGLVDRFPGRQLARILASTRLVGMIYPGLHSIYSSLRLDFSAEKQIDNALHYEVTRLDSRFRTAKIQIRSGEATGNISCFFRKEPHTQSGIAALSNEVRSDEFIAQRALVIGGSRGLGEVTAKILAQGGASVALTYASGISDAEKVVADISSRASAASCFQWDALDPMKGLDHLSAANGTSPTHLYYFATPHISIGRRGSFSPAIFRNFCEFYVSSLNVLIERSPNLLGLFYPSSIALDHLGPGWSEYAAAKAAGEIYCRFLRTIRPDLKILSPRLPKLATDQTTGSYIATPAPDPAEFLLPLVREMNDPKPQRSTSD